MKAKKQTAKRKPNHLDRAAAKIAMSARASWGSLVRRAVREAWKARGEYDNAIASDTHGMDNIGAIPDRIERKYGVRL